MQLSEVVATHRRVAEAAGRGEKADLLAELLGRAPEGELPVLVGLLSGRPRQGRVGVGPSLLRSIGDPTDDTYTPLVAAPSEPDTPLTVAELDTALTEVAAMAGRGSQGRKAARLRSLFRRTSRDERTFVELLVIGELRQGAGEGVLLDAVARASGASGPEVRGDVLRLGGAAAAAERHLGGDAGEVETGLRLFRPLAPMLAGRAEDAASALAAIPGPLVEAKADGARVQVHRRGGEVRVYTRRSNEITDGVPEIVAAVTGLPGGDLVLDGEAIGWGPSGPLPFQTTMRRIGAQAPEASLLEALPLRVFFFDCLFADGDLLDRPLGERREALTALVPVELLLPSRTVGGGAEGDLEADRREVEAFLDEVRAAGFEGLMVKDLASPYRAGRRGGAWLKLKPVDTLDLVVLAAEWGSGRRRGRLSNLHLGARGEEPDTWVMLGKTFKGMTDEVLAWQTEALLARETHRDRHTVHVRPELVVEIAFEGVQRSPRYPGGVSLRFARLRRYREDKSPDEADPIEAVRALLADETQAGGQAAMRARGRAGTAQRDLFDDTA